MSGRFTSPARGAFVVAHRGASDEAPENTLPAFERAIAAGCPVLECDVHLSRDGVVVVLHDATLERTTDAEGAVEQLDWSQIAVADAGHRRRFGSRFEGTRVPRLEEVLELARGRAELMIEIKQSLAGAPVAAIASRVLQVVADLQMLDAVGVVSMSSAAIRRVRWISPATTTGLVSPRRRRAEPVSEAVACGADYLIAPVLTLQQGATLCDRARDRGLRVGAYGVVSAAQLQLLVSQGVESLACDDPAAMVTVLAGAAA